MFKNISILFHKKKETIEEELDMKTKVDEILSGFIQKEILKNSGLDCQFSYAINKGIIKIETSNKIIAQEIALRIRGLEEKLKREGVVFRKLLI
ncbi:MAG: hypothetical protein A3J46_03395 [Candidatus Yanofskybacteria bacterium RIFCSPHIGHO2_02_FULL_41_11]|uniref:Uncharacterized protein n=1 Tax=Candidatus Yanofskybacteria bacterium RIFCSPHIGHO2_02_FULL_41_11 TaxID=1802675 RepID=A0A1F8FCE5_9BACT|nr:MAG: hypothetical protein A3J46_03395 [Candidatus Yanofskybacteria bacterium RIFCSPHIGHO2_02_FULL_41_11]